jgi:hypothetical protein
LWYDRVFFLLSDVAYLKLPYLSITIQLIKPRSPPLHHPMLLASIPK